MVETVVSNSNQEDKGDDEVRVEVIPDSEYVLEGVLNTKNLLIQIISKELKKKEEKQKHKRRPIVLCFVLDRSGSMQSEKKLNFAIEAVTQSLLLLESIDVCHLVTYNNEATVDFKNFAGGSDVSNIQTNLSQIKAGGGTNISEGIKVAADLLKHSENTPFDAVKRIYLFSDGQANSGLKGKSLHNMVNSLHLTENIFFESFGIGSDYDSDVMKGIAEHGGGKFYFLEGNNDIEHYVTKSFQAVQENIGTNAKLFLRGVNGALVSKVAGFASVSTDFLVSGVPIGDITANNMRQIFYTVSVPGSGPSGNSLEFFNYELKYISNQLEERVIKGTLSLRLTDKPSEAQPEQINVAVRRMSAMVVSSEMDEKIADLLHLNKFEEAENLQKEQIAMLEKTAALGPDLILDNILAIAKASLKKLEKKGSKQLTNFFREKATTTMMNDCIHILAHN